MTRERRPAGTRDRAPTAQAPRGRRWGLRTLAWLGLSLASVLASNALYAQGVTEYVLATFAGTVVGFAGAAYCSVRGLMAWEGFSKL